MKSREGDSTRARVLFARMLPVSARSIVSAINIGFAAVLIGVLVYPTSHPTLLEPAPAPAVAPSFEPEPVIPEPVPVRMVNPFDDTEVFEFPPGTSESEARELVANLLIERARSRLPQIERRTAVARVRTKAT